MFSENVVFLSPQFEGTFVTSSYSTFWEGKVLFYLRVLYLKKYSYPLSPTGNSQPLVMLNGTSYSPSPNSASASANRQDRKESSGSRPNSSASMFPPSGGGVGGQGGLSLDAVSPMSEGSRAATMIRKAHLLMVSAV